MIDQVATQARRQTRGSEQDSSNEGQNQVAPARNPADEEFLAQIGQRVRRIRALRGMSRKVLAEASDISERYIAQLEGGMGNVSVLLLRRVAKAAGVTLDDLIGDAPDEMATFRELLHTADPEVIERAKAVLR